MPSISGDDDGTGFGVRGTSVSGHGVDGAAEDGNGVRGRSSKGNGVFGFSKEGVGVSAESGIGIGLSSKSKSEAAVLAESVTGAGVDSTSKSGIAVVAESETGAAVSGMSRSAVAVVAESKEDTGVLGIAHAEDAAGVFGLHTRAEGTGVAGQAEQEGGSGVIGNAPAGVGVFGNSVKAESEKTFVAGVVGSSVAGTGVVGLSESSDGVYGQASAAGKIGVKGQSNKGFGVVGISNVSYDFAGEEQNGCGVLGENSRGIGVEGNGIIGIHARGERLGIDASSLKTGILSFAGDTAISALGDVGVRAFGQTRGVIGYSYDDTGVRGNSIKGPAVHGFCPSGPDWRRAGYTGWAGYFDGDVRITGTLRKSALFFLIDHPLDPANKYLEHSAIESSEMKNVYDGVVILNKKGSAIIKLPAWFEALNENFRYQLTAVGRPAPELHVAKEIADNRFTIAGGPPETKVCWQVTGTRRDAWARANPMRVEQNKPKKERGLYIHPEAHGKSVKKGIAWAKNGDPSALLKEQKEKYQETIKELKSKQEESERPLTFVTPTSSESIRLPDIPTLKKKSTRS